MTKHSTSTIPRPAGAGDRSGGAPRPESHEPGDHTRLIQRRRNRQFFGVGVAFIVAAIIAALLVLPLRAWKNQRTELANRTRELAALEAANGRLQGENDRLQTVEGIEAAARNDYSFRASNEVVIGMLPPDPLSGQFPIGWPYSAVNDIFAVRSSEAAAALAAAAAASTIAPVAEPSPQPMPAATNSAEPSATSTVDSGAGDATAVDAVPVNPIDADPAPDLTPATPPPTASVSTTIG